MSRGGWARHRARQIGPDRSPGSGVGRQFFEPVWVSQPLAKCALEAFQLEPTLYYK